MGYKKKWIDTAEERERGYLDDIQDIIGPLFDKNGRVDLTMLDPKGDLAFFLAVILNAQIASSEDKHALNFGADDIVPLRLEIENNSILKYWGLSYCRSIPKDHACEGGYRDPFYGEFKLEHDQLSLVRGMLGDYEKKDLDSQAWIDSDMDWMYEL